LLLLCEIGVIPLRVSGYVVFVAPSRETYSLLGDGSFIQGVHPIITDAGPIEQPVTLNIPVVPPRTISAGSYKVYAALVAYDDRSSSIRYLGSDSAEFTVTDNSKVAEGSRNYSDTLTIITYAGYSEGHLIAFPDATTMSIDCATGDITTKSHFHNDHCAECDSGNFHRNNVTPGQVIYSNGDVTVTVVAANKKVVGQGGGGYVQCESSQENQNSMALLIRYRGFDYLAGGDMYASIERSLGSALAQGDIHVDVLKVNHHGSNSSSDLDFLLDILPEYAVVSGHASHLYPETFERLKSAGVKIVYDTYNDQSDPRFKYSGGDITITTDGYYYSFSAPNFSDGPFPVDDGPASTPTATPSSTPTWDPSAPTYTPTVTPTRTLTPTPTRTPTRSPTPTITATPTITRTPTITPTITETPVPLPDAPWPMFHRDAAHRGQGIHAGARLPDLKWSYDCHGSLYSSPAVDYQGSVYIASTDNNLYSLNSGGSLKWSYAAGDYIQSSPSLDRFGRVYVGGGYSNSILAFDLSGVMEWSYRAGNVAVSPMTCDDDGRVFTGFYDNNIYVFNRNGAVLWSYSVGPSPYGPVALDQSLGIAYCATTNGRLRAFTTGGALTWSYNVGGAIYSSPAVAGGSVYIGSIDNRLRSYTSGGILRWSYLCADNIYYASPGVGDNGLVLVGSWDQNLYALTSAGSFRWSFNAGSMIETSPAIDSDGCIYFGSGDWSGGLCCALDSGGAFMWSHLTGGNMYSSPAIGEDGTIFIGSTDYMLYAMNGGTPPPTPTGPTLTPTISPTPTPTRTPTVTPTITPTPYVPPFRIFWDPFSTTTLFPGNWDASDAESNADGIGEPSAPYSLNLDGKPSGGDEIQSVEMDLSAQSVVSLTYYWERKGGGDSPEPGEDLWIDYKNSSGSWVNLRQYGGDGPDMT
jgi:outer membrane protein assembly factor BamB